MAKSKKEVSPSRPKDSSRAEALRVTLGLDEADWKVFLRHALFGFEEFERSESFEPDEPLRIKDVPDEWFELPDALGLVTIRVVKHAKSSIADPMARHFLSVCESDRQPFVLPAGIGVAWLHLARRQSARSVRVWAKQRLAKPRSSGRKASSTPRNHTEGEGTEPDPTT